MLYYPKLIVKDIYTNIAIPALIAATISLIITIIAILTTPVIMLSGILGTLIGGMIGPLSLFYLRRKYIHKISKSKKEINELVEKYSVKGILWTSILIYLMFVNYLIVINGINDNFSFDNFIFYFIFSALTSFNLYGGLKYYTAWLKYRNSHPEG